MPPTTKKSTKPRLATQASQTETSERDAINAEVEKVLNEALYWFPVRHHSPAVARHLQTAIAERKPKIIFIEGPAEAMDLIPYIVDKRSQPPIAIYSSYRDDDNVLGLAGIASAAEDIPPRFSTWYPMAAYSPEYIAIKAAAKMDAEVIFMDLPHYGLIRPAKSEFESEEQVQENDIHKNQNPKHGEKEPTEKPYWESLYPENRLYQALAHQAGFASWDEAWDSLFEFGEYGADHHRFRRELATFCYSARALANKERLQEDGTFERERFMWRTICTQLKEKNIMPQAAMVVCGGFHLFLDRHDEIPPPTLPAGSTFSALMPYSFFRMSELSGYGAGNRAPRFYQTLWDLGHNSDDWLADHIVAIMKQARKEGEVVSSADAISVAQHTRMLAALRGRVTPILEDIQDAVITCCCKGDPEQEGRYLLRALDVVNIGKKIGRITPSSPRLPLVNDLFYQLKQLQLEHVVDQDQRLTIKIDKRQNEQRQQSVFFHRLSYLKIPLCHLIEGNTNALSSGTIFKEVWRIAWTPSVEPGLIENNLYGDTLETAVFAHLEENLAKAIHEAGLTCRRLREAIDMELPALIEKLQIVCQTAIAQDGRFISLTEALHELNLLKRHSVYQGGKTQIINELVIQAFNRACFSLPESANVAEQEQEKVVDGLRVIAETLLNDADQLDKDLFVQYVRSAASVSQVAFLQGALLGMLAELRIINSEQLSADLAAFSQASPERMTSAGDFLDGMLAVCRTSLMLGAEHLIIAIEELLKAADEAAFLIMLPRMRLAFNRLHQRQQDTLANKVAERVGLKEKEQLTKLNTSLEAAALFAKIDRQVDSIMKQWSL